MTSSADAECSAKSVDPDFDLVARAKVELPNRTQAYEELLRRHESLLYRVCRRIMGNDSDADDVFQETMVKVFNSLPKFEHRSTFKTWLFTIAHNTCYSSIKRIAKAREYKNYMTSLADEEENIDSGSDAALDVERVLSELSAEDREMLTLKYVGGLKFEEIAEICDLGVSAVKMRIYRAAEYVRKKHTHYQST